MELTNKQKEIVEILSNILPIAPPELAQSSIKWYKDWKYKEVLNVGDRRSYNGVLYEVYSQSGDNLYTPDKISAIWKVVYTDEYAVWNPPEGAHNAYNIGDKVKYNNERYISKINGNTTIPGTDDRWWENKKGVK